MYDSISPHLMSVDFFLLKLNNSLCINMIKTCFTKNIKNGNDFSEYRTHIIDKNSPKLTAYHITPKSTNWREIHKYGEKSKPAFHLLWGNVLIQLFKKQRK